MSTWGVTMCKDEADIVHWTVEHMLTQVDGVIVADNGSTDGTREILNEIKADDTQLLIVDDPEVGYYQSRKMTALAAQAARRGAEWVVPFDADEFWYSPHGRIADVLATLGPTDCVAVAEMFNHIPTAVDDATISNPFARIGWRLKERGVLWKVAARTGVPVVISQGNHAASYPAPVEVPGLLVVRHFPYRSPEQMIRKARNGAAAYAATDLPETEGEHWRGYARFSDEELTGVFRQWFWADDPAARDDLIYDPATQCLTT